MKRENRIPVECEDEKSILHQLEEQIAYICVQEEEEQVREEKKQLE